jgi:carboxyl-terminal processing protease
VTPQLLDQFQAYLSSHDIRPGVTEWSIEQDFIVNRLKTEIFNQAFGVAKGDEVEVQRDPVVQKALEVMGS